MLEHGHLWLGVLRSLNAVYVMQVFGPAAVPRCVPIVMLGLGLQRLHHLSPRSASCVVLGCGHPRVALQVSFNV